MRGIILILSFCFIGQSAWAQSIDWSVAADIVGTSGHQQTDLQSDFYIRSFELSAMAPIDHTFDGVFTLAHHQELEDGEKHFDVHEAFISSSKLLNLSNIKVGRFLLGFGRLNRIHRHDWEMIDAPMVHKSFFGNEAVIDTGIEYKRNLVDWGSSITMGVTSGSEFVHVHNHEEDEEQEHHHAEKAKAPTSYIRFAKFFDFSSTSGLELGFNAINRLDAESTAYQYLGMDFVYKQRSGRMIDFLLQSEFWTRISKVDHHDEEESQTDSGFYIYYQHGIDQHHALGLRTEYYRQDGHHHSEIDGLVVKDNYSSVGASYIYTNSEFMRTVFTIERGEGVEIGHDHKTEGFTRGFVQLVVLLGAHPAHEF